MLRAALRIGIPAVSNNLKNSIRPRRNINMKVAIEGCCHGELDKIYSHIASLEKKNGYKVDLLLICGDFQAIRNHADLQCMAVPQKYRQLGGFHKYYLGQATAPMLTIVIGGNHEASNYLWELYHGGWLAPNIYFLGFSGCVQVNGVRIAGASGIYKIGDYYLGHHEAVPYDNSSIRSIYHIRQYDVFKLSQLSSPDVFLSHDWPNTIERHGDTEGLLRRKPFFRQESQTGTLGSPPMFDLLKKLKPRWWFSAHLHVKFEALYRHDGAMPVIKTKVADNPDEIVIDDEDEEGVKSSVDNPDAIKIDDDDDDEPTVEPTRTLDQSQAGDEALKPQPLTDPPVENTETHFLALDKCLPRRDFLQVIDIPVPSTPLSQTQSPRLTFDPEWLAITRALHPFLCTTKHQTTLPKADEARGLVAKELEWVRENVADSGLREINDVQSFWRTAPGPNMRRQNQNRQPPWYTNPQTEALAQLLQIPNKINPVPAGMAPPMVQGAESEPAQVVVAEWHRNLEPSVGLDEGGDREKENVGVVNEEPMAAGSSIVTESEPVSIVSGDGGWSPSRIVE